ncbi:hypothetical protein ES703_02597 [subsurface metagenome]
MGLLETKIIKKIKKEVEAKFPDMKGVEPHEERIVIEPEPKVFKKLGVSMPKTYYKEEVFKLSFKKVIKTEDGFEMQRTVRVLVNKSGKIIKFSTSK